jgi:hypothetical protein
VKDNKEYLLCGQDYQGYTIVDLSNGVKQNYVPEAAYQGLGFCWGAIYHQDNSNKLIIDGCYWAHPYDLVIYDFSDPMCLPYRELHRISSIEDAKGWKGAEEFVYVDEDMKERSIKINDL